MKERVKIIGVSNGVYKVHSVTPMDPDDWYTEHVIGEPGDIVEVDYFFVEFPASHDNPLERLYDEEDEQ